MKNESGDYKIFEGNINQLQQIVLTNYEIFKEMYGQEPYSLEDYQERLKDQQPKIFIATLDGLMSLVIPFLILGTAPYIFGLWEF